MRLLSQEEARDVALAGQARRAMAARARVDPAAFCQFVLRDEHTGARIRNAPMHHQWHRLLDEHDRLLILAHVDSGKLLPTTLPIPTPSGWGLMGDLRPGDEVFGRDGRTCIVTWVSSVETPSVTYRLTFDDGATLEACADHRWLAKTVDDAARETAARTGRTRSRASGEQRLSEATAGSARREARRREAREGALVGGWRVVTTQQMLDAGLLRRSGAKRGDGTRYDQYKWRIPLTAPVEYGPRSLPVHPYVLGVWLGNGDADGPQITLHGGDAAVGERCLELEGRGRWLKGSAGALRLSLGTEPDSRGPRDGTRLVERLRALGVLQDKHVPEEYLLGSIEQRRELLAGLLDTDGYVSEGRQDNRVEFCNTNERLALGCLELARSLGFKATVQEGRALLEGRDVGPKWRVGFTAHEPVFWSPRKLRRQAQGGPRRPSRVDYRSVVAVEPVASVPMRCISVDSLDHSYLAGRDYVVTHNSAQVSIGRTLFNLGVDHNRRVVIVTKTAMLAQKLLRAISQYITKSEELHLVFPSLKRNPDPKLPWNVHQLTVDRDVVAKDPSVQACGIFGNIHGSRIDDLILDDVIDSENTRTKTPRDHLWNWVRSTLMGRLTGAARVAALSNAWHPEDVVHRLAREPGYRLFSFPVLDEAGEVTWPEHWPAERIEKKRQDMGPYEFARAMLCQARDDDSMRFKREWIDDCCARGVGKLCLRTAEELYDELLEEHPEWVDQQTQAEAARLLGDAEARGPLDLISFYTGVDLAFSKRDSADLSAIFTIAVFPNGDRRVLSIEAGRWDAPELIGKIEAAHRNYGSIVMVESVGAQRAVIDMLVARSDIPVVPYGTGTAQPRLEFQVESLAVEMMNKKWIIPSGKEGKHRSREVDLWIGDLFDYDPTAHLSDRTAACCFAVACSKQHDPDRIGSVGVRVISAK